jgi:hypothetical protein
MNQHKWLEVNLEGKNYKIHKQNRYNLRKLKSNYDK